jgi:cytochrome c oxidase subunit 2
VPSLQLLYTIDEHYSTSMVAVCEGHQWYWNYKVGISEAWDRYIGVMSPRLLATTTAPSVPGGQVSINVTRSDVLHRFALPALACKADAVPGRINTQSLNPSAPGMYLGQCRELCGANHRFMPTALEVR